MAFFKECARFDRLIRVIEIKTMLKKDSWMKIKSNVKKLKNILRCTCDGPKKEVRHGQREDKAMLLMVTLACAGFFKQVLRSSEKFKKQIFEICIKGRVHIFLFANWMSPH